MSPVSTFKTTEFFLSFFSAALYQLYQLSHFKKRDAAYDYLKYWINTN